MIMIRTFFFVFLSLASHASCEESLTLDQVLISLRDRFPLILALEQQVEMAEGKKLSALGEFDLKWKNKATVLRPGYYRTQLFESTIEKPLQFMGMNVYGGYRQGDGKFAIYDEKYETLNGGELHSGFGLPLMRDRVIDQRRASLKMADIEIDQASREVDLKKIQLVFKASEKYWSWVAYGLRKEIAKDLLETARNRILVLTERVKQGDVARIELVDNKRTILQREAQVVKLERDFQNASIELSLYLRDDEGMPIIYGSEKLPQFPKQRLVLNFDLKRLVEMASQSRPELKSLMLEKNKIEVDSNFAENQLQPKLDVFMELSKDLGSGSSTKEQTEVESGVLLEIPLQRRKAEGKLITNQAEISKIGREIEFIKNQIKADVQDAISGLKNAAFQIELIREELSYAREVENGERDRFKAGESTILLVNLRELATADTAAKEVMAVAEYQIAEAMLHAALGKSW